MNLNSINSKELIEYITKEVMKQIGSINMEETIKEVDKDRILAIPISDNEFLDDYKDLYHIDYLNDIGEDLDISLYKYLILEGICIQRLVSISMGLPADKVSSRVIDFILQDKKIYVLNEGVVYHQYKNTSNISFYNMMKSYEDKLKCFGIDFINKLDLKNINKGLGQEKRSEINNKNIDRLDSKQDPVAGLAGYKIESKIITESNLRKIYQEGHTNIIIQEKAIITPLANDFIRSNGIDISIE